MQEKLKEIKSEYIEIKEFNVWSLSMGWEKFSEQYNTSKLTFEEYIETGVYVTPSSWVKKMANYGDMHAINEMIKRQQFEIDREETVTQRQAIKNAKVKEKRVKETMEWQEDKFKTIL